MVIFERKQVYRPILVVRRAIVLAVALHMSSARAAEIGGFNICVEDYALCSAALCRETAGDGSHVVCQCEGPFRGLNVGHSSCRARAETLTSTFSLQNQFATPLAKPVHTTQCTGDHAGRWADCLDAACTTDNGSVTCTCPVKTSDFFFLGSECADTVAGSKSACSKIRSGAPIQHNNQQLMSSFYADPPKPPMCPAIRK